MGLFLDLTQQQAMKLKKLLKQKKFQSSHIK